jgi:shikimate kinase
MNEITPHSIRMAASIISCATRRFCAREGRPLSEKADLEAMFRERLPLYERFRDAAIDNNAGTPEQTAAAIWRDFHEHSGD